MVTMLETNGHYMGNRWFLGKEPTGTKGYVDTNQIVHEYYDMIYSSSMG